MADYIYMTPLINAASRGKLKYVKIFIDEEKEDVNKVEIRRRSQMTNSIYGEDKTTALHEACRHGHLEVVKYLLQKGARVNGNWPYCGAYTKQPLTPLSLAAKHGHAQVVRCLLDKGADVDGDRSEHGSPPLDYAIRGKHIDVVQALLHKKARLVYNGQSALHQAVQIGCLEMVGLLVDYGSNINERCKKSGLSPLSQAISANDTKIVAYLLKMGANYRQQDLKTRFLPLQSAIRISTNCKESVEFLLEFVKKRQGLAAMREYLNNNDNLDGKTTLHVAFRAYAKNPIEQTCDLIKSLLAYGADPTIKDDFGREPHYSKYIRDIRIRKKLVDLFRKNVLTQWITTL